MQICRYADMQLYSYYYGVYLHTKACLISELSRALKF